jgi:drug/metabolite transporter (DMT)-like permease
MGKAELGEGALPVSPHVLLLLVQIAAGGYHVLSKHALQGGVDLFAFSLVRDAIASTSLSLALLLSSRRSSAKPDSPRLPKPLLRHAALLGATGVCGNQLCFLIGLNATSPATAASMQPSIPVLTFVASLSRGAEELDLRSRAGWAKLGGVFAVASGALFAAGDATTSTAATEHSTGVLALVGNCLCMAAYFTLQDKALEEHPYPLSLTAYAYVAGTLFLAIGTPFFAASWHFEPTALIAALYAGTIASACNYLILSAASQAIGPTATTLYLPLQPVASGLLGYLFLGIPVPTGTMFGGTLILAGLYSVSLARASNLKLQMQKGHADGNAHAAQNGSPVESLEP